MHNKVPNDVGMMWRSNIRKGNVAVVPNLPCSVAKINTSYDNFFKVRAAQLWNCLPKTINTLSSLESFKSKLDVFIMNFPDRPSVAGYSTANGNSILDWFYSRLY